MLAGSAGLLLITAAIGLLIIVHLVCRANRDQAIASECVHHFIVVKCTNFDQSYSCCKQDIGY